MDPLGIISNTTVKIDDLVPWQKTSGDLDTTDHTDNQCGAPLFTWNEEINKKIFLWNGDISRLAVQALILPVYEILSKSSKIGYQIQLTAGPRLLPDVQSLTELRTSEVCVHNGYDLPARYIIHTVEPRYNPRYRSAADNSLHICYRSSLQVAAEKHFTTVAISLLHITRKGFPVLEGTHIALRTIRKCLEMLSSKFEAVVVVTDPTTADAYADLFPAYFPRSNDELVKEMENFPSDISYNEWGTFIQPERAIRIADVTNVKQESIETEQEVVAHASVDHGISIDQSMIQRSFASMSGDHDKKRKFMMKNMSRDRLRFSQERIYQRLLRIARNEDFSKFSALKCVRVSGRDVNGNQVVVIIGRHMPMPELHLEKVLLFLILTLESVINERYTVVYFHTNTTVYNHPTSDFLRKLYNTFDQRYKSNLARFCMVHMTAWTKVMTWLFASFNASEIKNRIVHIRSVPQLYTIVPPDQIDVPPFVLSYDMETNPDAYSNSPKRSPANKRRHASGSNTVFNQEMSGAL